MEDRGSGSPPGKSQVAIGFLRNSGTDPPPPLEKQLYPSGPIASRGRSVGPFVIYVDDLKNKRTPRDGIFWIRK